MRLNKLFEELDKFPPGSRSRMEGVGNNINFPKKWPEGQFSVKLCEPALLYVNGGGYRLEIWKGKDILTLCNSPRKGGIVSFVKREIETAEVLKALIDE